MTERVLLIGGGGYIGNVVAYQFLQNKYDSCGRRGAGAAREKAV